MTDGVLSQPGQPSDRTLTINPFRNKSCWELPHNRDAAFETYIRAVEREVINRLENPTNASGDNPTMEE